MPRLLAPLLLLTFVLACGSDDRATGGVYLALGDSISRGVGASDRSATAFVPLVKQQLGEQFQLINLSHSGDTSQELLEHGHLDQAIAEIRRRKGDDDPANDIRLLTLGVGGNDLLDLLSSLLSGPCLRPGEIPRPEDGDLLSQLFALIQSGPLPSLRDLLNRPECVNPTKETLEGYQANLKIALARLQEADLGLPILLLTLYNPLADLPLLEETVDLALEGQPNTPLTQGINDLTRSQAVRGRVFIVDIYALFKDRSRELIAADFIHPNDAGHQVIADAVIKAWGKAP